MTGSAALDIYDPEQYVKQGLVYVAMQYRYIATHPLNETCNNQLSITDLGRTDFYTLEKTPAHQETLGCWTKLWP